MINFSVLGEGQISRLKAFFYKAQVDFPMDQTHNFCMNYRDTILDKKIQKQFHIDSVKET